MRQPLPLALVLCLGTILPPTPVTSQSIPLHEMNVANPDDAQLSREIHARLNSLPGEAYGCRNIRKEMRKLRESERYSKFFFAFAKRNTSALFGARGCGYAWNIDPQVAQDQAMAHCKNIEKELTDGKGPSTCELAN
ncbi:hypothetical protein [Shimia marina]|uniref:Uncharacterized protein n=1 Tax=Shimia marina TaxID=321267 RepID=A0A0P1FFE6_9RHOB|nr:hypothetical protein [Shimia marina]CUH53507.1 hypothetical protein SHM7688_02961 [Shimia marina]SFD75462.1 hypothetical protein SAMN04488037_102309 [Shimia marina]